jgi:uncharacterized protein (TIGR02646 family)
MPNISKKIPFRQTAPKRSYNGPELSSYRKYKKQLQEDFNQRCGYTDCPDFWFGGVTNFQIDHFKPKSKFPALTTHYPNLVYSCAFVNRAKSNDFDEKMYLDPCEVDYNKHFSRDENGNIFPVPGSPAAQYMYKKMKLYLKRYGIIWMLTTLQEKMQILSDAIKKVKHEPNRQKLVALYYELSRSFQNYFAYLGCK